MNNTIDAKEKKGVHSSINKTLSALNSLQRDQFFLSIMRTLATLSMEVNYIIEDIVNRINLQDLEE